MMRIHISRYALLVALLVMFWATESMAATIDFNGLGLTGHNLKSFTGSYGEDGFTVAPTSGGKWFEAHIFGNGVPAIGAGDVRNPDGGTSTITVDRQDDALFTFGGVDLTSNSAGGTKYTIAGFQYIDQDTNTGSIQVFTTTFQIDTINQFESKLFDSDLKLFSELGAVNWVTITGTRGTGVTSFNIDNIRVAAASDPGSGGGGGCTGTNCPDPNVPEPASIMLLGAGLAGIEIWRRRRGKARGSG